MIGAIAGDIIGSAFESFPVKRTDFDLFAPSSRFTDDTVLTIASAHAILRGEHYRTAFKSFGRRYPGRGYGNDFHLWVFSDSVEPYNSWGNGSAMRVSPIGRAYDSVEAVLREAARNADVTHNHPEGVKGAQAVALAVFLARKGASKLDIRNEISGRFGYELDRALYDIRKNYSFDVSCQGSVPESIIAFLESDSYEDAVRNAVSLGGDSDTMACIAGAIAEAYYRHIPGEIVVAARSALPAELLDIADEFDAAYPLSERTRARNRPSAAWPESKLPVGRWDPCTRAEDLPEEARRFRFAMQVTAKRGEWTKFLAPFEEKKPGYNPVPPNLCVPDGKLLSAPLHLAAQCGAPVEIARKLIMLGAWRTLQNGHGERPVDVAARARHHHLLATLEPEYRMRLPWGVLRRIEHELHATIRDYAGREMKPGALDLLRLPQVEPVLETVNTRLYFEVPGFAGGFNFGFEGEAADATLVVYAFCRVSGGSGAKYEITQAGYKEIPGGYRA